MHIHQLTGFKIEYTVIKNISNSLIDIFFGTPFINSCYIWYWKTNPSIKGNIPSSELWKTYHLGQVLKPFLEGKRTRKKGLIFTVNYANYNNFNIKGVSKKMSIRELLMFFITVYSILKPVSWFFVSAWRSHADSSNGIF